MRTIHSVATRTPIRYVFRTVVGASLVMGLLAGCKTDPDDVSYKAITSDLTPEMLTLTQREVDANTAVAVTTNADWRMFWMDLGRVWLMDRPSTLSPYTTIATSGNPQ